MKSMTEKRHRIKTSFPITYSNAEVNLVFYLQLSTPAG